MAEILHNLEERGAIPLKGRDAELRRVYALLSPTHREWIVRIAGDNGTGKTALALESCWWMLAGPPERAGNSDRWYDAIIWISNLTDQGAAMAATSSAPSSSLMDRIYAKITETLHYTERNYVGRDEQAGAVRRAIEATGRVLIVFSNVNVALDSNGCIRDPELARFIHQPPKGTKFIITSRISMPIGHEAAIELRPLSGPARQQQLTAICQARGLFLSKEAFAQVAALTLGNLHAMMLAVGQITVRGIDYTLELLRASREEPLGHLSSQSLRDLWGRMPLAYQALLVLSFFEPERGAPFQAILGILRHEQLRGAPDEPLPDETACLHALTHLRQLNMATAVGKDAPMDQRYKLVPAMHSIVARELTRQLGWVSLARERWVAWYENFTRERGGPEWIHGSYAFMYRPLAAEWPNVRQVFEWCYANEQHTALRAFWDDDHLRDFANMLGFWSERDRALEFIIQGQRLERHAEADFKAAHAYTLILMARDEHLSKAEGLLHSAHACCSVADVEWSVRCEIANHILMLAHRRAERTDDPCLWDAVRQSIEQYEQVVTDAAKVNGLNGRELTRRRIEIPYYQGMMYYATGDLARARQCFQDMLQSAERIEWLRANFFAKNWLAEIAIQERQYETARRLLHEGSHMEECRMDERRYACYHRSYARLEQAEWRYATERATEWATEWAMEQAEPNPTEACHWAEQAELHFAAACQWAEKARKAFHQLGMNPEEQEMHALLRELN